MARWRVDYYVSKEPTPTDAPAFKYLLTSQPRPTILN